MKVEPLINQNNVHVWLADLRELDPHFLISSLSPDELVRANRFHFSKDRNYFICGRGILRKMLSRYLNQSPELLQFQYNDQGKPSLAPKSQVEFNLSHAGDLALLAITCGGEVGVDIESIDRKIEINLIAPRSFARAEVDRLFALPTSEQVSAFYRCWTRKEALIKAIGRGLSFPLDQFVVSLGPNEPAQLLRTFWDEREAEQWKLFGWEPAENYLAALAIRNPLAEIKYFNWHPEIQ